MWYQITYPFLNLNGANLTHVGKRGPGYLSFYWYFSAKENFDLTKNWKQNGGNWPETRQPFDAEVSSGIL